MSAETLSPDAISAGVEIISTVVNSESVKNAATNPVSILLFTFLVVAVWHIVSKKLKDRDTIDKRLSSQIAELQTQVNSMKAQLSDNEGKLDNRFHENGIQLQKLLKQRNQDIEKVCKDRVDESNQEHEITKTTLRDIEKAIVRLEMTDQKHAGDINNLHEADRRIERKVDEQMKAINEVQGMVSATNTQIDVLTDLLKESLGK